jgi:Uma2 family endonuclease
MATTAAPTVQPSVAAFDSEPLLEPGDRLSRAEFERRYGRMPNLKKAELIEGTVFMPSPVRIRRHAHPHIQLSTWLGTYVSETPGLEYGDNATVRLDLDNEPQPDLVLLKSAAKGGQAQISTDDYIEGAPELAIEIVGSSHAYDLHQKKGAYRRNGVLEYLAWITGEKHLVWWELREGEYHEVNADFRGILKSRVFPGLWLDTHALLKDDIKAVLATLRQGLASSEHSAFVS